MNPTIGDMVTYISPDDPGFDYLDMAYRLIVQASSLTDSLTAIERRQNILLSCISSFFCLEASINRLFYETFDRQDSDKRKLREDIPSSLVNFIQQTWPRLSVRDKFLLLPPLISEPRFEFAVNQMPFNLFDEFIRFRNRLVHPRMIEHTVIFRVTEKKEHETGFETKGDVLEERLAAPARKGVFPLTHFSTSFRDLQLQDAETALEIAFRMQMELFSRMRALIPVLLFRGPEGRSQVKIGESIATLLTLRFGPPPS